MNETSNVVPITTPEPDEQRDLRVLVRGLMSGEKRLSQAQIAKETGISSAALSQWLNGLYAGDNDAIEAKLQRWADTTQAARARADTMPVAPDYVETPTAERVISALRYAQIAGDIAVVYGGAGLGKTSGIARYTQLAPNVWHATMSPACSAVVTALEQIAEVVGLGDVMGGAAKLHRSICRRVQHTGGLLVIDEAQHLSVAALDQIRSIHDATGIGIALVGNEQVYARMTGGNRAAYLDRLFSRIGKKVRLIRSTQTDIDKLIAAWGIRDAKCHAQLAEIAGKPGALRGMTKVLRLAAMYAVAEQREMASNDIRAAWRELGGVE